MPIYTIPMHLLTDADAAHLDGSYVPALRRAVLYTVLVAILMCLLLDKAAASLSSQLGLLLHIGLVVLFPIPMCLPLPCCSFSDSYVPTKICTLPDSYVPTLWQCSPLPSPMCLLTDSAVLFWCLRAYSLTMLPFPMRIHFSLTMLSFANAYLMPMHLHCILIDNCVVSLSQFLCAYSYRPTMLNFFQFPCARLCLPMTMLSFSNSWIHMCLLFENAMLLRFLCI